LSIVCDLERTNQLNLLPDKDLVDLCPHIEPYQVTKNRIKIAVERAIADILHELKFYYVAQTEVEDEENIPTEPYSKK
jgi:hypothetical protein